MTPIEFQQTYEETWSRRDYPTPKHVPFLTPDQFLAIALQAFFAARQELTPPKGEYWLDRIEEGPDAGRYVAWSGPEGFYDALLRNVTERLRLAAIKRGDLVRRFYSPAELVQHAEEDQVFYANCRARIDALEEADRCVAAGGKDGDQ